MKWRCDDSECTRELTLETRDDFFKSMDFERDVCCPVCKSKNVSLLVNSETQYRCQGEKCFNNKKRGFGKFDGNDGVCPFCDSDDDVIWIPKRHNGSAASVDQTLRDVADRYKLSDMGQRGGTRMGETPKHALQQEKIERYHNVNGVNIPVTNNITSTWADTNFTAPVSSKIGSSFGGSKKVPTRVTAAHREAS